MNDRYMLVERRINGVAYPPVMLGTDQSHHARLFAKQRWTEKHASIKVYALSAMGDITLTYELVPDPEAPGSYKWAYVPLTK